MIPMQISLKGGWEKLWSAVSGAAGTGLTTALTVIGVALVLIAVIGYIWQRRRGGGGQSSGLIWTLIIGAILAGPTIVMPLLLTLIDWILNMFVNLGKNVGL